MRTKRKYNSKSEGDVERTLNSAKRSFEEGWKLWGEMYYGSYEPAAPALPPLLVPTGGALGISNFGAAEAFDATVAGESEEGKGSRLGNAASPYLPIPCGHRDLGALDAESERTFHAFAAASGVMGLDAKSSGTKVTGCAKIAPNFRTITDAEGMRADVNQWQLWTKIIAHELEANRLGASPGKYAARVLQFLQWRVSQLPHHAAAHLDLIKYILESNSNLSDRIAKVRNAMEYATVILPESKLLIAEFGKLLKTDLADESHGHTIFSNAVERAKIRLALLRQVPLASPLGANFLQTKHAATIADVSSPAALRKATALLTDEDIIQHAKLLSYARAQADESLKVTQSLLTWYALWLRWAQGAFMADGRFHMRLVAKHAFDETNIVMVVVQEVQRLYKGLSLPFFVDPTRSMGEGETDSYCGSLRPNSVLSDLLALLTTSGNSAVEVDTCIRGRGAGGSIVFSPRHHFASLNALCKLWCHTEAVSFQSPEHAFVIFQTWGSYLQSMVKNTANRFWSPLDCGVDESFFATAHQLLQCRPEDKQRIFRVVRGLVAVLDADENSFANECALRLFMRFDPKNEWGWSSTENIAAKIPVPATIEPTVSHVASLAFGPLGKDLSAASVIHRSTDAAAGDNSLLLELASRWRNTVYAFDATADDFAPATVPLAGQSIHCDVIVEKALSNLNTSTAAASESLAKALASALTVPSLTPFDSFVNPNLFSESYLDTSDDLAGLGTAAQITDMDSNDNPIAGESTVSEAQRQRDILLGVGSGSDPLAQNPFTWWAPSRNMKSTPHVFAGLSDLIAAIPSTVPFVGQGILDSVRSQVVAEYAKSLLNTGEDTVYHGGVSRGAASRADVVSLPVLSLLDQVGLTQISSALDTFALPLSIERFRPLAASEASNAALSAATAAYHSTSESIANAGLAAYTEVLVSNFDVGYEDVPAPLDGREWMGFKLPTNERLAQHQRMLRQHHQRGRGGRGGRGGIGGRGGDRGRGGRGRGGWQQNVANSRRSLLTLMDDEEKANAAGEGEQGDFESEDDEVVAEAQDRTQGTRIAEGVYHQQHKSMSQFASRSFAIASNPYRRSLEFSMDKISLMLATRKEQTEAESEDIKRQAEEAERARLREDRDKRLRSEHVYAAPMDTPSAIMAAHSRQQRALAAASAVPLKGVQQTALQTASKTKRRIVTAITSKSYPVADAWMHMSTEGGSERRSVSKDRTLSESATDTGSDPTQQKGYQHVHAGQHEIERGNSDYASLHYLLQCLPRHTLSSAVQEAEETTGASAYTSDSLLQLLQGMPSLRSGAAEIN